MRGMGRTHSGGHGLEETSEGAADDDKEGSTEDEMRKVWRKGRDIRKWLNQAWAWEKWSPDCSVLCLITLSAFINLITLFNAHNLLESHRKFGNGWERSIRI